MLGFPGTIYDASHYRYAHIDDARIALPPNRHLLAQIGLNVFRHMLEKRRCRATAARTRGHLGCEALQLERLKNLLCNTHFLGSITAGSRSQRDANRITDPFREQDRKRSSAGNYAFGPKTCFG